ncbi:MAG: hypothetical protein J6D02_12360 [Lachnospira sp.]|nr:hypothetical protein [Lachnospira sp.]
MLKKDFTIAGIVMLFMGVGLFMILGFLQSAFVALFGGTLFPKNYSKKQAKQYISGFAPDATYITRKKMKKTKKEYYLYKDAYGREFIVVSTSVEGVLLYSPKLYNSYECCILQKNINEIKTALEDTGLKYNITGDAAKMQDDNMLKWATETPSLAPMDICFYYVKEEDMMLVANAMAKIDGILKYNYNKKCSSVADYGSENSDNVFIYFKNVTSKSMASFKLSTCESERWTPESIYECIQKQFKQNKRAIGIDEEKLAEEMKRNDEMVEKEKQKKQEQFEQKIQRDILNYLEEKYDETFITDAFSYFTISDTNDEVLYRLSCERLPAVRVEVTGTRNENGAFDYTDDFEEGKRYNGDD